MCLTTKNPDIKTARRNILCYKEGIINDYDETFTANAYNLFRYDRDKKQLFVSLRPNQFPHSDIYEVSQGYHSHNRLKSCRGTKNVGVFVIPKNNCFIDGYNNTSTTIKNRVSESLIYVGPYLQKRKVFKSLWKISKIQAMRFALPALWEAIRK